MRAAARWMRACITVKTVTGVDGYGQPTYATTTGVHARVVSMNTRSVTPSGEEFISRTQVQTFHNIRVGDALIIDGEEAIVRSVKSAAGVRGGVTLVEAHV